MTTGDEPDFVKFWGLLAGALLVLLVIGLVMGSHP